MPNTDISEYLNAIESAESGEIVRDSVHDAIQRLATNGVSNAQTLDGHPASHFALKSDVGSLNNLDQTPTQGHYTVGVTSGGVWDAIHDSTEILARMTTSSAEDMNLYQAVVAISTAAGNISNALDRKTAEINHELDLSGTAFTRWEEAINNWDISTIKEIDLSDKEFTENTTDLPGGWADAGDGKAWKRVKVEVSPKLTSASIDELDEHYSGSVNITDPKYKDYNGFDTVSVDIADGFMDLDLGNGFLLDNGWRYVALGTGQAPSPIPEKTKYFGTPENPVYGFRQVNIIIDQNSRFTVTFWNEDGNQTLAVVENVPYGGQATFPSENEPGYRAPIPIKSGYSFNKWNPNPVNVMSNMNVYASYIKNSEKQSDASSMSWGEIASEGANRFLRGTKKRLYVGTPEGFEQIPFVNAELIRPSDNVWAIKLELAGRVVDETKYEEQTVYNWNGTLGRWESEEVKLGIHGGPYNKKTYNNELERDTVEQFKYVGWDWDALYWCEHEYEISYGVKVPKTDKYRLNHINRDAIVSHNYLRAVTDAINRNQSNDGVQLTERSVSNTYAGTEDGMPGELVKRPFTCGIIPLGVYDMVSSEDDAAQSIPSDDRTPYINVEDLIAKHDESEEVPGWNGIIPAARNAIYGHTRSTRWEPGTTTFSPGPTNPASTNMYVICTITIG